MTHIEELEMTNKIATSLDVIITRENITDDIIKQIDLLGCDNPTNQLQFWSRVLVAKLCKDIALFIYGKTATEDQIEFIVETVRHELIERQNFIIDDSFFGC